MLITRCCPSPWSFAPSLLTQGRRLIEQPPCWAPSNPVESLATMIKCSSLEGAHITTVQNTLARTTQTDPFRHQGKYNATMYYEGRGLKIFDKQRWRLKQMLKIVVSTPELFSVRFCSLEWQDPWIQRKCRRGAIKSGRSQIRKGLVRHAKKLIVSFFLCSMASLNGFQLIGKWTTIGFNQGVRGLDQDFRNIILATTWK